MKTSLLISTYNRPDTLLVCLDSVRKQTILPDEIVIADDGSKDETKNIIKEISKNFPVPIIHVWQEDDGFRKSKILNKAVAKATGDYIIEVDGDVFLHPKHIQDHLRFAEKGYYVKGGRVNLNKTLTEKICKKRISPRIHFWTKGVEGKRENIFRNKLLSGYLAPRYRRNSSPGIGCNMSFWKEDYIRINGYDEFFEGWGGEDYDFASRMMNSGVERLYLKFSGIVYHLWHNDLYMQNKEGNFEYYNEKKDNKAVWTENGIDKYLTKNELK